MNSEQFNPSEYPLVKVENLSFSYESMENPLLSNINFTLNKNEVTLLMGGSGSGKSTISLCLNGLYPEAVEGESSGCITFKGKNIDEFLPGAINQQIGVVFQDPESQFCMLHVEDELAFTLENFGTPVTDMPALISKGLKLVGMEAYKNHKLHALSGGEKQKIALASVLLMEPELLILDEATVNLDPASTEEFIQIIQTIQKERKMSVLIIDHQADDWLPFTDRVLLLGNEGKIIADEPPAKLFTAKKELLKQEGIFLPKVYDDRPSLKNPTSPPSLNPILHVEGIRFDRQKQPILNGINMDISSGEFVSIVGENGAGKSTLLEIIAGITKPASGNVILHRKPYHKWEENALRKRIGFVFQNPEHQFITDTVYDEITFGMKLRYSEEVIEQSASSLLQQFQLEQHPFHNPFSLSGGQKRRLSVATALDETPDILLFDEPTFGQDAHTSERLMETIMHLRKKGIAIVFVTHDMDLASLSDTIFVVHNGRIAFFGTPGELWTHDTLLEQARLRLPSQIRNPQMRDIYDYSY